MKKSARQAFDEAVSRLSKMNQQDLWITSSLLSCVDYFDSWNHPHNFLFPTLNMQNTSMFVHAILRSNARDYKKIPFTSQDISHVFNILNDASYGTEVPRGANSIKREMWRFLAAMGNFQFRFQRIDVTHRMGRTFAMLHEIPQIYQDELQSKQGKNYVDLVTQVPLLTGLNVQEFLLMGFSILGLIKKRFDDCVKISDDLRAYASVENRQPYLLIRLIDQAKSCQQDLVFTVDHVSAIDHPLFSPENVRNYLKLISHTPRDLQDLLSDEPIYRSSRFYGNQLSPLERYPVIALAGERYVIPHLRYFDAALTEVLHYILQKSHPNNAYNELRGFIQEKYLHMLVQESLPQVECVPEISYKKKRNRVDGPDLTLIDRQHNALIVVESKAKRMSAGSRMEPASEKLMQDLERAFEAFTKLPGKIEDLYAGIPEYSHIQTAIETTRGTTPMAVVILGQGLYLMPEIVKLLADEKPDNVLHDYRYPYCLIGLTEFERAVEIAVGEGISLYDLLLKYWQQSLDTTLSSDAAELFANRSVHVRFIAKYSDAVLEGFHITE